jgi:hypothetical protein
MIENERPKPGDPLALYWVWGTIDAARGIKYEECPFKEGMVTRRLWEKGYQAYQAERKNLKMEIKK